MLSVTAYTLGWFSLLLKLTLKLLNPHMYATVAGTVWGRGRVRWSVLCRRRLIRIRLGRYYASTSRGRCPSLLPSRKQRTHDTCSSRESRTPSYSRRLHRPLKILQSTGSTLLNKGEYLSVAYCVKVSKNEILKPEQNLCRRTLWSDLALHHHRRRRRRRRRRSTCIFISLSTYSTVPPFWFISVNETLNCISSLFYRNKCVLRQAHFSNETQLLNIQLSFETSALNLSYRIVSYRIYHTQGHGVQTTDRSRLDQTDPLSDFAPLQFKHRIYSVVI